MVDVPMGGELVIFSQPPQTKSWTDFFDFVNDSHKSTTLEIMPGTPAIVIGLRMYSEQDEDQEYLDLDYVKNARDVWKVNDSECEYPVADVLVNGIVSFGWALDTFEGFKGFTSWLLKEKGWE